MERTAAVGTLETAQAPAALARWLDLWRLVPAGYLDATDAVRALELAVRVSEACFAIVGVSATPKSAKKRPRADVHTAVTEAAALASVAPLAAATIANLLQIQVVPSPAAPLVWAPILPPTSLGRYAAAGRVAAAVGTALAHVIADDDGRSDAAQAAGGYLADAFAVLGAGAASGAAALAALATGFVRTMEGALSGRGTPAGSAITVPGTALAALAAVTAAELAALVVVVSESVRLDIIDALLRWQRCLRVLHLPFNPGTQKCQGLVRSMANLADGVRRYRFLKILQPRPPSSLSTQQEDVPGRRWPWTTCRRWRVCWRTGSRCCHVTARRRATTPPERWPPCWRGTGSSALPVRPGPTMVRGARCDRMLSAPDDTDLSALS